MKGTTNRRKGHDLERKIARLFQELGFAQARTARAESTTLDSCGVDIANIPLLIQCKRGYDNRYPRYPEIREHIKQKLQEYYGEGHENHSLPIVLIHQPTQQLAYWSFDSDFAVQLVDNYFKSQKLLSRCLKQIAKAKNEIVDLEDIIANGEPRPNNPTYDSLQELYQELKALLDK